MDQWTYLLADALLTGIIIFGFQKYWEHHYNKKQFKEQLKFQIIHEKEVEAVGNIHKKILEFVQSVESVNSYIHHQLFHDFEVDRKEVKKRVNATIEKMDEFMKYLQSTSIFIISDDIKNDMESESGRARYLHTKFVDLLTRHNLDDELDPEEVRLQTAGFTIRKDGDYSYVKNVRTLLSVICDETAIVAKTFEIIYKSVVHAEDK